MVKITILCDDRFPDYQTYDLEGEIIGTEKTENLCDTCSCFDVCNHCKYMEE